MFAKPFSTVLFLGTAKIKPYIEIVPEFSPFYSDETGRKVPNDVSFDMEHAFITADVNRYNEDLYQDMLLRQRAGGTIETPVGSYEFTSMGTMVLSEKNPIELWIVFPNSVLAAYQGMPAGYHFPNAIFSGPDRLDDLGVSDRAIAMSWHALPDVNVTGDGFLLYDFDISGTAGVPRN
jgi:hypothetical protein